jgi:segregation and condensation protein A
MRNLRTYLRLAPPPKIEGKLDLSNITIGDLIEAARDVYAKEIEKQALGTVISAPKITIREKIELISRRLGAAEHARFRELLGEKPTRIEIVVTFLALLELVKRYRVAARQEGLFADIEIERMNAESGRRTKLSSSRLVSRSAITTVMAGCDRL